jgi:hypothetical protein
MAIEGINIHGSSNTIIEGSNNVINNNSPTSGNSGGSGTYGSSGNSSPIITSPATSPFAEPADRQAGKDCGRSSLLSPVPQAPPGGQ